MALRIRARHSNGFSLIEMMIAIVFIMISMLALLTATMTSVQTNMRNELRNNAIQITNQTAEVLLALPLDDPELSDGDHLRSAGDTDQDKKGFPYLMQNVRGYQQEYKEIKWRVVSKTDKIKEVTISVDYDFKDKSYSTSAVIYKHEMV